MTALADNEHVHIWGEYRFDITNHWCICSECGQEIPGSREVHVAFCNEISYCAVCGVPSTDGITISDIIHASCEPGYDKYQHWYKCNECGEYYDVELHWTLCTKPKNKCINCEATTEEGAIIDHLWHEYDSAENTAFDRYSHWYYCKHCGEIIQDTVSGHSSVCTAPDVCQWCGARKQDGAIISSVGHVGDLIYKYDKYEHQAICSSCGEISYTGDHMSQCTNRSVCYYCGASTKEGIVLHEGVLHQEEYIVYTPIDRNSHEAICSACNEKLFVEEHVYWSDDLFCDLCGFYIHSHDKGDTNGDGAIDGRDLLRLARYTAGNSADIDLFAADLTGDGVVDGRDVLRLAKKLAGS